MRTQVEGHVKIGEAIKGIPSQWKKLKLTELFKGKTNTFELFRGTSNEGYDEIKVKLPFIVNIEDNFNIRELAFVKINKFYKYIAFVVNGIVYLEPYAPNFNNPMEDLPTIALGEEKQWGKNINLAVRSIGYFTPIVDGKELGVFDFKTSSAHSIESMRNSIQALSVLPMELLINAEFKLKVTRRIFESQKNDEVAYLDFIIPSYSELMKSLESVDGVSTRNLKKYTDIRKKMEDNLVVSDKRRIANAISFEDAVKYFNTFEVTSDEGEMSGFVDAQKFTQGEDVGINPMNSVKEEKSKEEKIVENDEPLADNPKKTKKKNNTTKGKAKTNREILRGFTKEIAFLKEKGLDLVLARKLVIKFGDEALNISEESKYNAKELEKKVLN